MFFVVRGLVFVVLIGVAISLLLFVITGQPRYKLHAVRVLKWTVYAALVFFGGVILQRL